MRLVHGTLTSEQVIDFMAGFNSQFEKYYSYGESTLEFVFELNREWHQQFTWYKSFNTSFDLTIKAMNSGYHVVLIIDDSVDLIYDHLFSEQETLIYHDQDNRSLILKQLANEKYQNLGEKLVVEKYSTEMGNHLYKWKEVI